MQDCAPLPAVTKHAPVESSHDFTQSDEPKNHIALLEEDPPVSAMMDVHTEQDCTHQNTTEPENPKELDKKKSAKENDDDAWSITAVMHGKRGDALQHSGSVRPHDSSTYTRTYCFHPQQHRHGTCACRNGCTPVASTATEQQTLQVHSEYTGQLVAAAQISAQMQSVKPSPKKWRFPSFGHHKNNTTAEARQAQKLAQKFTNELQVLCKNLLLDEHWDVYENFQVMLTNGNTEHHLIRLLTQQLQWDRENHGNTNLDVGIHYTEEAYLKSICRHGLLNRQERQSQRVVAAFNGRSSGDGIYTADNPLRFVDRFGKVGLIVLRLRGEEITSQELLDDPLQDPERYDTLVQLKRDRFVRSVTVRNSSQCAVLLRFDSTPLVSHSATSRAFVECLNDICGCVSDLVNATLNKCADAKRFFLIYDESKNKEDSSLDLSDDSSVDSSKSSSEKYPRLRMVLKGDRVSLPKTMPGTETPENPYSRNIVYEMPSTLADEFQLQPSAYETVQVASDKPEATCQTWLASTTENKDTNDLDACPICMEEMKDGTIRLTACGHTFHLSCLTDAASRKTACPMCRSPLGRRITPRGHMPSGSLFVRRNRSLTCAGHPAGTIVLRYILESGNQQTYHPNPCFRYYGTTRVAYVPDSQQGRQLVDRLVEAFQCGLTFCVGTSLTTGRENVITWASIPHKTCTSGGAHGYPDPHYFDNCHAALDALHVNKPVQVQDAQETDVFYDAAEFGQSFNNSW